MPPSVPALRHSFAAIQLACGYRAAVTRLWLSRNYLPIDNALNGSDLRSPVREVSMVKTVRRYARYVLSTLSAAVFTHAI
jgi:hypothetical protein